MADLNLNEKLQNLSVSHHLQKFNRNGTVLNCSLPYFTLQSFHTRAVWSLSPLVVQKE